MYFLLKMWAFVLGDSVLGDFVLGAFVLHSHGEAPAANSFFKCF